MITELERLPLIPPVVLYCDGPHATSPPAGGTLASNVENSGTAKDIRRSIAKNVCCRMVDFN
jgi:hypothetical protein